MTNINNMNKKLQNNLKTFQQISEQKDVVGYVLITIAKDENENIEYYHTFNAEPDTEYELIGVGRSLIRRMETLTDEMLYGDREEVISSESSREESDDVIDLKDFKKDPNSRLN